MARKKSTVEDPIVKAAKETIAQVATKIDELEKVKAKAGKEAVNFLKELVQKSPYVEAIRWKQYTPGFNDGDECVFGIHDLEFKFADTFHATPEGKGDEEDDDGNEYDDDFISYGVDEEFFEKKKDIMNYKIVDEVKSAVEFMQEIHNELSSNDEILKSAFGDDAIIVVTKKGVDVEEYCDHD